MTSFRIFKAVTITLFAMLATIDFASAKGCQAGDVELFVHNPCKGNGKECFVLEFFLNGRSMRTYEVSPGNRSKGSKSFPAANTPVMTEMPLTSAMNRGYKSNKRRDPMPYAMHINGTGFAVHGSWDTVNGWRQSHGCVRMHVEEAKELNCYVKAARAAGKTAVITTRDTLGREWN